MDILYLKKFYPKMMRMCITWIYWITEWCRLIVHFISIRSVCWIIWWLICMKIFDDSCSFICCFFITFCVVILVHIAIGFVLRLSLMLRVLLIILFFLSGYVWETKSEWLIKWNRNSSDRKFSQAQVQDHSKWHSKSFLNSWFNYNY